MKRTLFLAGSDTTVTHKNVTREIRSRWRRFLFDYARRQLPEFSERSRITLRVETQVGTDAPKLHTEYLLDAWRLLGRGQIAPAEAFGDDATFRIIIPIALEVAE